MCNPLGKLKTIPGDFRVSEAIILPLRFDNATDIPSFWYAKLTKSGYTTFEAVMLLASKLGINYDSIGYAGLKDEDGITEQYISVPTTNIAINEINIYSSSDNNKFVRLTYVGGGEQPLSIGGLCGNNFCVVVRDLDKVLAEKIYNAKTHTNLFINYYGTQRFGLPGQNKTTHLLGEMLLKDKHEDALSILQAQDSLEGRQAREHKSPAKIYFDSLDTRILSFYQNSYYSHKWNEEVKEGIIRHADNWQEYKEDKILYFFTASTKDKIKLLENIPEVSCPKIRPKEGQLTKHISKRSTLIQYNLTCNRIFKDEFNANKWCCELSFFLPSGCYATIALQQFLFDNRTIV